MHEGLVKFPISAKKHDIWITTNDLYVVTFLGGGRIWSRLCTRTFSNSINRKRFISSDNKKSSLRGANILVSSGPRRTGEHFFARWNIRVRYGKEARHYRDASSIHFHVPFPHTHRPRCFRGPFKVSQHCSSRHTFLPRIIESNSFALFMQIRWNICAQDFFLLVRCKNSSKR